MTPSELSSSSSFFSLENRLKRHDPSRCGHTKGSFVHGYVVSAPSTQRAAHDRRTFAKFSFQNPLASLCSMLTLSKRAYGGSLRANARKGVTMASNHTLLSTWPSLIRFGAFGRKWASAAISSSGCDKIFPPFFGGCPGCLAPPAWSSRPLGAYLWDLAAADGVARSRLRLQVAGMPKNCLKTVRLALVARSNQRCLCAWAET